MKYVCLVVFHYFFASSIPCAYSLECAIPTSRKILSFHQPTSGGANMPRYFFLLSFSRPLLNCLQSHSLQTSQLWRNRAVAAAYYAGNETERNGRHAGKSQRPKQTYTILRLSSANSAASSCNWKFYLSSTWKCVLVTLLTMLFPHRWMAEGRKKTVWRSVTKCNYVVFSGCLFTMQAGSPD